MKKQPTVEARSNQALRNTPENSRYTFSGKERDGETGYSYFGARYYNSDISIWLSVDPLSDKYPHQSNYVYCSNNPIRIIDPNGEDEWEVNERGEFRRIKECEGNDVIKSTRAGIEDRILSGNGVLNATFSERRGENGEILEQSFEGLSKSDAKSTFGIAAESSSFEWGYMEKEDIDGNISTFIGSNYNSAGESFVFNKAMNVEEGCLLKYDHSHPCTDDPLTGSFPSHEGSGKTPQYDDIGAWKSLLEKHLDASMGIYFKAKGTPSFLSSPYQLHVKKGVPHSIEANKYW